MVQPLYKHSAMAAPNLICCRLNPSPSPPPPPPILPTLLSSHYLSLILRSPSSKSHLTTFTMNASNLEQMRTIATTTTTITPSSSATMSGRDPSLDPIFKQKRVVRSRVRKELKAMDPVLRSHEGHKEITRIYGNLQKMMMRLLEDREPPYIDDKYMLIKNATLFNMQLKSLSSNQGHQLPESCVFLFPVFYTAIQDIILESSWFRSSRRLCAYISCTPLREVDTSNILSQILSDQKEDDASAQIKKKLYVPRVEDKNSHMRMFNISSTEDMVANSMGILEPTDIDSNGNQREDVMVASEPVDLLLLPGLAFDKSGRRLGRAGGYYDTFLRKYKELCEERKWKLPLLVGLSYSVQILEDGVIPVTQWDVNVDALVTPAGVLAISPAAQERILL